MTTVAATAKTDKDVAIAANTSRAAASSSSSSSSSSHSSSMSCYQTRPVAEFERLNLLGEGTYGTVYKARDKISGEIVALKLIRPLKDHSGFPLTSIREIELLRSCSANGGINCPYMIRLRGMAVGRKQENIFLVFDYCPHDFASLIDRMSRPFSEGEMKTILIQLLTSLEFMHRNFMIHRDLKLSNLLIDQKGKLKLADFGLARTFTNPLKDMTPKVVTLWYRAPELLLQSSQYHSAVDIWSVGCIFGELLHHRPLLPGTNESQQWSLICNLLGTPNEKIWPGFTELYAHMNSSGSTIPADQMITLPNQPYNNLSHEFPTLSESGLDLLGRFLTYDPSKRITAEKALQHPYFQQTPLPCPEHLMPTFAAATTTTASPAASATSTAAAAASHHKNQTSSTAVLPVAAAASSSSSSLPPLATAPASLKKRKLQLDPPAAVTNRSVTDDDESANKRSKQEDI